ncbi:MAG: flagellar protein FliT [bacterium]|nr:flagellar protein FliT [bacterium]
MTDFAQLKLLYKQFLNLSKEIDDAIKEENYELASKKTGQRESLIEQMFAAYKTANITDEERKIIDDINSKIQEKYKKTLDSLQETKSNVLKEIKKTKTQSKIVNAYEYQEEDASNGIHVDIEE